MPISVSIPVATTTAFPLPYTTVLPINAIFFLSPRGTSPLGASMTSQVLSTGTDSPVSAASSIFILAHSIILASAGTASPASSTITSPTTKSSLLTVICLPSRNTLLVAAAISCSASIAFSALLSCTTPRIALISTTAMMMITSEGNSPLMPDIMPEMTAATMRMIVIGSANCLRKRRNIFSFLPSASLFLPFFSSLQDASAVDRPSFADCTSSSTWLAFF